jgi:hypothetical protein
MKQTREFETFENICDPGIILFSPESIERFSEAEIANEVACCKVKPADHVDFSVRWPVNLLLELSDEQIEVSIHERLLLTQSSFRKGMT